jgi:hypothetical protein
MTLQTSGAISLNNVNVELGRSGTTAINMNETVVRTLAGKASGAISMSDFYGKSNATVTLEAAYGVFNTTGTPDASIVSISFESDGDIITNGFSIVDAGDWISPKSAAPGSYEIRATLNSGDTPVGTLGSWLALTSTRTWSLTKPGNIAGFRECELTVEIRLGATVLDSTIVTLSAEVFDSGGGGIEF